MAIIDSLIMASCISMSGQSNDACQKALQAGSQQSGIQQTANSYENHQVKLLERHAYDWFGKDAVNVTGGGIWLTKSIVERKASFGLYGPLSTEIGNGLTRLVLKWTF